MGQFTSSDMSEEGCYSRIAEKVSSITGVQLGDKQRALVRSRLAKRMRELGGLNVQQYYSFLQKNESSELSALISLLTTHHTFFFREFAHFEFLQTQLPALVKAVKAAGRREISIWSAACSHGQEVYSLAMFLRHHLQRIDPSMGFKVYGSDVDENSVKISSNGVYPWDDVKKIPALYLSDNFARGTGDISNYAKVKKHLKQHVEFFPANLVNLAGATKGKKFDVVFCRNVFIYFTHEQIAKITKELTAQLYPHGHLIVGLSETLTELQEGLKHLGRSIYGFEAAQPKASPAQAPAARPAASSSAAEVMKAAPLDRSLIQDSGPVKVVCIDDSPTVLALLKRMLSADYGFEVIATAKNGLEAAEVLKTHKPDVVTLDIHMPEQNGVEYLKNNYNSNHPPVVVVSSVSREDSELALKTLQYGATDYIEKPALENLGQRSEEIRTKLNLVARMSQVDLSEVRKLETSFARSPIISNTEQKLRVVTCGINDLKRLKSLVQQFRAPQPPTIIAFESPGQILGSLAEQLEKETGKKVSELQDLGEILSNRVYLTSSDRLGELKGLKNVEFTSMLVLGDMSKVHIDHLRRWPSLHLVIEDLGRGFSKTYDELWSIAQLQVPATSFSYESDKVLSEHTVGGRAA